MSTFIPSSSNTVDTQLEVVDIMNGPYILRVRSNPSSGEFSSIQSALNSISDNSQTKLYQIIIDPGVWSVSSTIHMKPYVLLVGTSGLTVLNWTGATDTNLLQACWNTSIYDMNIGGGVTGTGYAIYYDGTSSDPANPGNATSTQAFSMNNVQFGAASNLGKVDGTSHPAVMSLNNCSWGGSASFGTGFEVVGGGRINVRSSITVASTMTAPYPTFMFKVHGANSILNMTDVSCETGGTSGICLWVYDGAGVRCSGSLITGFARGLYAEFVGAAPLIYLPSVTFYQNTLDLDIAHTGAAGFFTGVSTHAFNSVVSPTFRWLFLDKADNDVDISNGLSVTFPLGTNTDVIPLLINQGYGLISGGVLSSPGGLVVNITDVDGYYQNAIGELARAEITGIAPITLDPNTDTYIYVDTNGAIATALSLPNPLTTILLGRVVTSSTGILLFDDSNTALSPGSQNYGSLSQIIFGPLYVSGSVVTAGSSPLKIDVEGGLYYNGGNEFNPNGGSDVAFTTLYRDVAPGAWVSTPGVTSVPTGFYDDGSGTLQPVPALSFTKHTLYVIDSTHEAYFLVYGQQVFASAPLAAAGPLPTPPPFITGAVVRIASFVVESGAAAITTILSERPFPTTQSSASTPVTAHAALTGLTLLDAGHTQFLMLNGTKSMSANLNMGGNAITNVGNVNGVDVSAHASRHLPLSLTDPLTTAAPLIAVSRSTSNAVGTANSFSRSDHQHAFDGTSIVTQTITNGVTVTAPSEDAVFDALALKVATNVAITGATKTKVTYDTKGLVTSGADATTADIADSSNKRYVTDANLVVIGNTSGTNTGDNAANNSTTYVGTTAIALNRASASQSLTGVSIDGNAGTATLLQNARTINGVSFNGSANITTPGAVLSSYQVVGVTSGPTNNTSTYALLPEMTVTFTPVSSSSLIDIDFTGTFSNSNNNATSQIGIFLGASATPEVNTERTAASAGANGTVTLSVRKMLTGLSGSQTISIKFRRGANTTTATGVERILIIREYAT